jgi:HK97 family phage portal protein
MWLSEKLNPVQPIISEEAGTSITNNNNTLYYLKAYQELDIVRRGVDMIVNATASFDYDVQEQLAGVTPVVGGMRVKKLNVLLNYQPNPFQDISTFRRLIVMDLILEGNAFIYFDGVDIYHLPACNIEILTDPKTLVSGYRYSSSKTVFEPKEIIHIQDNAGSTIYRGEPRLKAAETSIRTIITMLQFQENFFKNGAVPGLIITSPNPLGDKIKERMLAVWSQRYNPKNGGKRPLILDGGADVKNLGQGNFQELDFENSIGSKERSILKALGVPPILLDGGNNANIAPNLKLFYLETILPIAKAISSAFERFFGYNLDPETGRISALQPQMGEAAAYYSTLVNGGIISPNEAREELRYETRPELEDVRVPQNIAGSAVNPSQGGKPPAPTKDINE